MDPPRVCCSSSWRKVESSLLTLRSLARVVILFIFTFEPCKAGSRGKSAAATRCQLRSTAGEGGQPRATCPGPLGPRVLQRSPGAQPGRRASLRARAAARGRPAHVFRLSRSLRPSLPALPLLLPGHVSPFFVCSGNNFSPLGAPRTRRAAAEASGRRDGAWRAAGPAGGRGARGRSLGAHAAPPPAPLPSASAAAPHRPPRARASAAGPRAMPAGRPRNFVGCTEGSGGPAPRLAR